MIYTWGECRCFECE